MTRIQHTILPLRADTFSNQTTYGLNHPLQLWTLTKVLEVFNTRGSSQAATPPLKLTTPTLRAFLTTITTWVTFSSIRLETKATPQLPAPLYRWSMSHLPVEVLPQTLSRPTVKAIQRASPKVSRLKVPPQSKTLRLPIISLLRSWLRRLWLTKSRLGERLFWLMREMLSNMKKSIWARG